MPSRLCRTAQFLTVLAASGAAFAQTGALRVTNPRCEYLKDPLAVDVAKPRLSWEVVATSPELRNVTQSAFQIVVTGTPPTADAPRGAVLWDSGKVASNATAHVEYAGKPLSPRTRAYWRVRVWDQNGTASDWSDPSTWAAGLLSPGDWGGAAWIADPTPPPKEGFDPLPSPMLRTNFQLKPAGIVHATAYITALGLYELRLNGTRVGDHVLAPEWTDYHTRVQYQAYDVTPLVRAGENALGVMLGDGWYAGKVGLAGIVPKGPPRAIYGRQPRVMMRLVTVYADGTETSVVTDASWRTTLEGPIRTADILDGETYDARREMKGWDSPGFDAKSWTPAAVVEPPKARLVAQTNEPMRTVRELKPIAIAEPNPGVYVVDMGQNMVGWCRVRFKGAAGISFTLRHAEVLNPDGTVYVTNLRAAAQTDRYTFRTDGPETFEPRFTYHGFRYVEVTGLASKPTLDSIEGCVVNSDAPEVGTFECSEPMLNRLWQNILWTQRANLVGVPTDCPQRDERCGWMGDILAFAPTACFNMDMAAFYTKWIPDTRDAQAKDGRFADFSPHPYDPNARFSGVPAWGDAGVFVPWVAYEFYGDTRILAEQFDAAKAWVEYIDSKNPDLLWKNARGNDYGDWLNADTLKLAGWPAKGAEVPKHVFATMFFCRSTQIVSEMAKVLGRSDDAKKYGDLADAIRAAFVKAYLTPEGVLEGDTQAGYALALHFGLIPTAQQAAATARMVDRFKPYDGQISTGFHSTLPLMTQLTRRGLNSEAYRLVLNRKMPSWGYEVDHGATTIWERWDGWVEGRGFQDPGMNSFSHYAIGAVGEWMYASMLGIRPGEPGCAVMNIEPRPGPGVSWVKGSYRSIRGTTQAAWTRDNGLISLKIDVPGNVSARVFLHSRPELVKLNGKPLTESGDVKAEAWRTDIPGASNPMVLKVGSGRYTFEFPE